MIQWFDPMVAMVWAVECLVLCRHLNRTNLWGDTQTKQCEPKTLLKAKNNKYSSSKTNCYLYLKLRTGFARIVMNWKLKERRIATIAEKMCPTMERQWKALAVSQSGDALHRSYSALTVLWTVLYSSEHQYSSVKYSRLLHEWDMNFLWSATEPLSIASIVLSKSQTFAIALVWWLTTGRRGRGGTLC